MTTITERIVPAAHEGGPDQIISDSVDLPAVPEGTGMVVTLPPGIAYVCTAPVPGTGHDGHNKTCVGQVLRVATFDSGRWRYTSEGVCQNIEHRDALLRAYESYAPNMAVGTDLWLDRFPWRPAPTPPVTGAELPHLTQLQRDVIAYLLSGEGDNYRRYQAFRVAADHEVFFPRTSDELVRERLAEVADSDEYEACPEGRARFREAFGLTPPTVRMQADVVVNGQRIGTVAWDSTSAEPEHAESVLTSHVSLRGLDRAVARVFYDLDGGEANVDFDMDVDILVENISPADD